MKIVIDRISQRGNPIAKEMSDGGLIHVPNGQVGETYQIELLGMGNMGYSIGLKDTLSFSEKEEFRKNNERKEKERERLEKKKRRLREIKKIEPIYTKKNKTKSSSNTWDNVDYEPNDSLTTSESQKEDATRKYSNVSNEENTKKNYLLNGKL